jgi:hypothetical protein
LYITIRRQTILIKRFRIIHALKASGTGKRGRR